MPHEPADSPPKSMNGAPADPEVTGAAARLQQVLQRIRTAAQAVGRDPSTVRLLAVSKTFPSSDLIRFAALGQYAFGENYLQEALTKIAALEAAPEHCGGHPPEWHFIGPLQSNKTRSVAEHFHWVHSVDRLRIATRLSEQRPSTLPPMQVCIQVNIDDETSKSGCAPADCLGLGQAVAALPGLHLRGLMTLPAPTSDPVRQRAAFARLRQLAEQLRPCLPAPHQARFDTLSMGMSGDLESAIAEGATLVRVGSALFGARPAFGAAPTADPH